MPKTFLLALGLFLMSATATADVREQYNVNWWTLGSGGGGNAFLRGVPASLFNASRINHDCDYLLISGTGNRGLHSLGNTDNSFKDQQGCPVSFNFVFPALSWSHLAGDLVKISGTVKQIDFIVDNVGSPITVEGAIYLNAKSDTWAINAFQTEIVSALVYDDVVNSFGSETINVEWVEASGLQYSLMYPLNDRAQVGLSSVILNRKLRHFNSALTDISKLEKAKHYVQSKSGVGLGFDLSFSYGALDEDGISFSIIGRQVGDMGIYSDIAKIGNGPAVDVIHESIDLSYGYRHYFDEDVFTDFGLDFTDLVGRVERNPLKRSHFFASLGSKNFRVLTGLNQGNLTFGLSWESDAFQVELGQYTEELGKTIGYRPDPRVYLLLAYKF